MPTPPASADHVFVGRARERSVLTGMLERAERGDPSVTTLVGEPGIGKTALAGEFSRLARQRGFTVVRGDADEVDRSTLSIWRGPMTALGIDALDPELVGDDRRWEALGTIVDALVAAAPVAVVLEDLHWADERSGWIVDHLDAALTGPVAVLVTTCAIERRRRRSGTGVVCALEGLSVAEVSELTQGATAIDAGAMRERTGGNPLFVLELLAWRPAASGVVPSAIDAALGHSIEGLSQAAQRSLGVLALGGTHARTAVIAAAARVTAAELREHYDAAIDHGVLVATTLATVQFRHALLAETVATRLTPSDRRALHADLAAAWRDHGAVDARARAAAHGLLAVPYVDAVIAAAAALDAAQRGAPDRSVVGAATAGRRHRRARAVRAARAAAAGRDAHRAGGHPRGGRRLAQRVGRVEGRHPHGPSRRRRAPRASRGEGGAADDHVRRRPRPTRAAGSGTGRASHRRPSSPCRAPRPALSRGARPR